MSLRVRYAIVVVPLFGTHWSYLPSFQAACVLVPVVRQVLEELQAEVGRVGMERQDVAIGVAGVRLVPDALAGRQLDRARIAEAAHAAQRAEVVIERAVLLHQEDDVLDVVDGAGAVIGRNGQRAGDARRKGGGSCTCSQKL